jgi:hypothetical protein
MIISCLIVLYSHQIKAEKRQFPGNNNLPPFKTQPVQRSNLRPISGREIIILVISGGTRFAPASCPEKSRIARFEHIPRPHRIKIPP